jgi:pilus assembly protein CpaC
LEGFQNLNPFRVRLNALFTNGDARLLARPNVTAVEGASAQITIGGERPVPKAVATQGAVGTQVEFRRFGVIITMRPTVSGDNTILLQIRADITQPDRTFEINLGGALIPGETVRSVDTTINVRPGDTVIMGGLMTNDKRQSTSKVPILGDLPIIGSLFRSRRFENNETELAIFMTPRIDASAAGMEEIENLNRVPSYPALPSRQESNSVLFQQTTRSAG